MNTQKMPFGCQEDDANCGVQMHGIVKVGEKWQIVIPKEVRDQINIKPGDSLLVLLKHGRLIGLVKNEDLQEFVNYMQQEIDSYKRTFTSIQSQ